MPWAKEWSKKWKRDNKDYVKKYMKKWKSDNKEWVVDYQSKWYKKNKNHVKKWHRKYTMAIKLAVFRHYSPKLKCQRCGFKDLRALSLDHKHGGGSSHVASLGGTYKLYNWVIEHNFPNRFQVLCMNCQWIKREERKEFPNIKKRK